MTKDLLKKLLVPIEDVQDIRGVLLPSGLEYLQLVVTGPPGSGKSYYINKIGGWPNEGYIDLTRRNWWKNRSLIYRPREVHLGMPFKGHAEALTVFDKEWLECEPVPVLEPCRIQLPPSNNSIIQTNWVNRYIFEFQLPDAEIILKRRKNRQDDGYFPVDIGVTLDIVRRQLQAYQEVALYLHRAGMNISIRRSIDGPPYYIAEKGVASVPRWSINTQPGRPSLKSFEGWKQLLGFRRGDWFTITGEEKEIRSVSRVAHDGKTFEMLIGNQRICFSPEIPLGVKRRAICKNWQLSLPYISNSRQPSGFVRIQDGETVIIGRSNNVYHRIFQFDKTVEARHVAISNQRGDLTFTPLTAERPVRLVRSDVLDYRGRLRLERQNIFYLIKQLFAGPIQPKTSEKAMQLLQDTIRCLEHEPSREPARSGLSGGIVRLDDKTIPVIVGDLHAQVDNLLKILSENYMLHYLENKVVTMVLLGDALHSEQPEEMEKMENSILMLDLLFTLKLKFPDNFHYIGGNHDSFSQGISKNGVPQGILLKKELYELRGSTYVDNLNRYFKRIPFVVSSNLFIACHAAPPRSKVEYDDIVNIHENPALIREVTRNRLLRPNYLGGYVKKDISRFRKTLGVPQGTPFIVGHTPMDPFGSVWKNVNGIKNHHVIYSAHQSGPTILQYIRGDFIPLSYQAEPLTRLINNL